MIVFIVLRQMWFYIPTWEDEVQKIKEAMLCCVCEFYMRFSSMFVPFGG
jgi:hypothetical protein